MEHTVAVEMIVKIDKSVYESSPWPNRQDFFQTIIIGHVDTDLNFFKREAEKLESPTKEDWGMFIKTLEGMKSSIDDTIVYELVGAEKNIEEVKINFSFKYYPTPTMSLEKTVETFIFMTPIQDNYSVADDITRAIDSGREVPEKSRNAVNMFIHAAEFMEQAKASLVIYKDGVILETPTFPKTHKIGM